MLNAVGPQGHVVAFEPIPQSTRQLQVTCRFERLTAKPRCPRVRTDRSRVFPTLDWRPLGYRGYFREDRPVLPQVGQTDRVFPYLEALGYRGYFFPHGRTEPLTRFRVERHQVAPDAEWLVNFGFLPKERV